MKKALATLAILTVASFGARAQELTWDVSGHGSPVDANLPASFVHPDVTSTGLTRSSDLQGTATNNSFNSTNSWNITATQNDSTNYITFSLTAVNAVTLTDLQYAINGSNTAPGTGEWGYSVNGGAFVHQSSFSLANAAPSALSLWDFNDVSLNPGDSVEFRFWAFGTTSINGGTASTGGTVRIANITGNDLVLDGSSAAVPEPATIGLIGLGLAGVVAFARRRKA